MYPDRPVDPLRRLRTAGRGGEARASPQGADWIHFDVMDNHYRPEPHHRAGGGCALKPYCARADGRKAALDVHLMVQPVDALVGGFAAAGADIITFHPEASVHVDRTLQLIQAAGCQAGLAFNPATPLEVLEYVIDKVDLVLDHERQPGLRRPELHRLRRCARSSAPRTLHRRHAGATSASRSMAASRCENIQRVAAAGADTFVAGSAIFGARRLSGGDRRDASSSCACVGATSARWPEDG